MDHSDSLRALIRRGRGKGYTDGLLAERSKVWSIIEECFWDDPRIDQQVERRSDYLSSLALETRMPSDVIAAVLRERQSENDCWLPVEVAGKLAAAGDSVCRRALLDYIKTAERWDVAVYEMQTDPGVLDAILSRVQDADEETSDAVAASVPSEMLPQLAESRSPKLASIARWRFEEQSESRERRKQALQALEKQMLAELLGTRKFDVSFTDVFDLPAFKRNPSGTDVEAVRQALNLDNPTGTRLALWWLKKWPQPVLLDSILTLYEMHLRTPGSPGWIASEVANTLSALPRDEGLMLARDWFDGADERHSWIASKILARRATSADLGRIEGALKMMPDDLTSLYPLCDLLQALARLCGSGWIAEVEESYLSLRYSYGRSLAAKALAAMDRERFNQTYAHECQRDCEEETRLLGNGLETRKIEKW